MSYVYHFKRESMEGTTLYPLNTLKETLPKVYEQEVKKYEGREQLLLKEVDLLDCLWNDVIHFSPINPQIILDTRKRENLLSERKSPISFEVFKIPIDCFDAKQTVCFQYFDKEPGRLDPAFEKFWKFDKERYIEQTSVGELQLEIWKREFEAGKRSLWYSHTLHILCKQLIDVSSVEVITCSI